MIHFKLSGANMQVAVVESAPLKTVTIYPNSLVSVIQASCRRKRKRRRDGYPPIIRIFPHQVGKGKSHMFSNIA